MLIVVLCLPRSAQAREQTGSPADRQNDRALASETQENEGERDAIWNGALIGAAVGASLGVVLAATDDCRGHGVGPCFSDPEGVFLAGGVMGAMGFGVGAAIDAMLHRDEPGSDERRGGSSRWIASPLLVSGRMVLVLHKAW